MSEEFDNAHALGVRTGIETAIAILQNCFAQQQDNRYAVDPMELAIEQLQDEIASTEPDRPVSIGPLPEESGDDTA